MSEEEGVTGEKVEGVGREESVEQSSGSSSSLSRAPQDRDGQQAELGATGIRQHGLSRTGLGNFGILRLKCS